MNLLHILLLFVVGLIAGVLNVLAGGGSMLTLSMLLFLGLPASMANGTNRVGIMAQNIVAVQGFRRSRKLPLKLALICTPSALVGSIIGARQAIEISDGAFRTTLAVVMLGVCVLMLVDPARRLDFDARKLTPTRITVLIITFFFVGLYGGFIQAGVGFLIISGLMVHGLDLVRANAIKVFVVLIFTISALAVFVWHGQVDWRLGLALAAGNSVGGWLGARLAISKGHAWIRRIVLIVVVIFALRLLLF